MAVSSSARKGPARAGGGGGSPVVSYGLLGLGVALLVLALATQLLGERVFSGDLSPTRSGTETVYTTRPLTVSEGLYDVSLSLRNPSGMNLLGRIPFAITSPDRSSWYFSGSVKRWSTKKKSSTSSSNRRRFRGSRLVTVDEPGEVRFAITLERELGQSLDVRIKKVMADYRFPLYFGLGLIALAAVLNEDLRDKISLLFTRFKR